jgi:hypothetical protein
MSRWIAVLAGLIALTPTAEPADEVFAILDTDNGEVVSRLPLADCPTAFAAIRAAKLPAPASQWKKKFVLRSGPNSEQIALPVGEFTEAILEGTGDEKWNCALQPGDRIYLRKPLPGEEGMVLCKVYSPVERLAGVFGGLFSWVWTVKPIRPTSAGSCR